MPPWFPIDGYRSSRLHLHACRQRAGLHSIAQADRKPASELALFVLQQGLRGNFGVQEIALIALLSTDDVNHTCNAAIDDRVRHAVAKLVPIFYTLEQA